jgi:hypothetical protein
MGPNLSGKVCVFMSQRGIAGGIAQHTYTTNREAERGTACRCGIHREAKRVRVETGTATERMGVELRRARERLGCWPRQSWWRGHGRAGRGGISAEEASPESQIYRRWWCLLVGSVLGWVGAASPFWCSVLSWVGSLEAEVGVGEREMRVVACGRENKVEGIRYGMHGLVGGVGG